MEGMEKSFEMRPLESGDIFLMTSIISKIGVKRIAKCWDSQEIKEAQENGVTDTNELGALVFYNIADLVLERLEYCEDAIGRLLSALSGKPLSEIKTMDALQYLDMFMCVMKDERFTDFFTRAYELLKRMM